MFGQRDAHKDDTSNNGAPAVPPAGTINTTNGIPDDHAVTQMLAEQSVPTPVAPPSFMPFSGSAIEPTPVHTAPPAPTFAMPPASTHSPTPAFTPTPEPPAPSFAEPDLPNNADELINMKQEALQHLQPLISNLQQTPEEEFRTLMMMIQATDDKTMLKKALEAAKKIGDEKTRAQAMLDVINEINYFTQTGSDQA